MEIKKKPEVDLENYRTLFFLIGLVISLAVVYALFTWKTKKVEVQELAVVQEATFEQEDIPITRQDVELPPPPKPKPQITDVIEIVKNDTKIEEEFNFDVETEESEAIEFTDIDFGEEEEDDEDSQIFFAVEQMPEFPGGQAALIRWIAEHIQYPVLAQENEIEGTVVVQFVVEKNGRVSNVKVLRGVDPLLDSEAVRVVKSLPRFKPGYQNGRPVRVWFQVPITFKLQKQ